MNEIIREWYHELKGQSRTVKGNLIIDGFESDSEYEDLYFAILEDLAPIFNGDYPNWYRQKLVAYVRYRSGTNRNYDFYCPQRDISWEKHSIQQQLAVLKFYIHRRYYSKYK